MGKTQTGLCATKGEHGKAGDRNRTPVEYYDHPTRPYHHQEDDKHAYPAQLHRKTLHRCLGATISQDQAVYVYDITGS
jgi:hypothetical protein